MIWDQKHETMDEAGRKKLQGERLSALIKRAYGSVPFYKKKMDELGVKPEDIKGIEDITKLPFLTKTDMRDIYPYGLVAVPLKDIVEIHTSSGTTGTPVVDAYTINDIKIWGEVMARTLAMGGTTSEDTVQNAYGYGLFTGGLGVHYGARTIGANVIPISGGNTLRQLKTMQDFKSTVLTCTPSYSLMLAEIGKEKGIDFKKLPLKVGFLGAEPWSDGMRREIEEKLNIMALDIYGLTEIIGPGVAAECECKKGLHIFDDHFYPEIIDPETGEVLPHGQKGELVFTTLTKEGSPVIRYRTRDITFLIPEKCECGRTSIRMHRILGRTDDMLIIRGVNVFPSQIEEVLMELEGTEPHYQIIVERTGQLDSIEVQVEMTDKLFSDEIKNLEKEEKEIEGALYSALNVHAKVTLVEPKKIPRSEGKAKRIIDKRKI
ncbi:MAG: phenylacetate--CoA ligase [Spirochaetales bacterium]|nr:phenylacetate--CoA ligase [Spirochaetales bacterium]